MALTSVISVDEDLEAINMTTYLGSDLVELINFDNGTKLVTFSARPSILISFSEFFLFAIQVNIYQVAVLSTFSSVNAAMTKPFNKMTSTEFHDVDAGNLDLTASPLSGDDVVSYEATKSTLKFLMNTRSSDVTLTFPEWVLFLQNFNHYKLSLKSF